jgi:hypothetical protein
MTLDLPKPIAAYFAADIGHGDAISLCFTEKAVVQDEGQTYHGRAAIKRWKTDAAAKYEYISELFAYEEKQGKHVVSSHLRGNFPGNQVDLRYFFELDGDKIASLQITT